MVDKRKSIQEREQEFDEGLGWGGGFNVILAHTTKQIVMINEINVQRKK